MTQRNLTSITRALLNYVIGLHRGAVLSVCAQADRAAEKATENVEAQKEVLSYENQRLRTLQGNLAESLHKADEQWKAAAQELNALPRYYPAA